MEGFVQKKIVIRTMYKLAMLFGIVILSSSLGAGSIYIGVNFFGDAILGLLAVFVPLLFLFTINFAYTESKHEVEREREQLIRDLTKNG